MSKIEIQGLVKKFGDFTALNGIDLTVEHGEFVGLLGPSGCGKTTTLNIVAGFETASDGHVRIDGKNIDNLPANKRGMGVVFQSYALFPHMTVAQNVAFGLEMRKVSRSDIQAKVEQALDLVRLSQFSERYPRQLSGGQQQRVAMARALAIEPSLLLLDEPLSNLDAQLREEMQIELRSIQRRVGISTIMVTHDQSEALAMCDRIAVMHKGKIAQIADPLTLYDQPQNQFTADFVGKTTQFSGCIQSVANDHFTILLDGADQLLALHKDQERAVGDKLLLAIRPEKIRMKEVSETALNGTITARIFQGNSWLYSLKTSAGPALVCELHKGGDTAFHEGRSVSLCWDVTDVTILSTGGENGK